MFSFFTGNAQVVRTKIGALQARIDELEASVHASGRNNQRLEMQISLLKDELVGYATALHKLRGQVHGPKAQEVERPAPRQVQQLRTKEELRRAAGIVAGRPTPHQSEQGDE